MSAPEWTEEQRERAPLHEQIVAVIDLWLERLYWGVFRLIVQPSDDAPAQQAARSSMRVLPLEVDLASVETLPTIPATLRSVGATQETQLSRETLTPDKWPPTPKVEGAKTYRYVLASGVLVRLRDLRPHETFPLPWWVWN